ncbi:MAG TPA: hypothetical protein DCE23_06805 [Firmicutes bacterium]|nr:hypothetical protein [Bacillota bacterium]
MSYEMVKEIVRKVSLIIKELDSLTDAMIVSQYNITDYIDRDDLVLKVIKQKIGDSDFEIYVRYCNYYRLQKEKEFNDAVGVLTSQIDDVTNLYNRRQELMYTRYLISDDKSELKREILSLPWIRLKIDYGQLKDEHNKLASTINHGIIANTKIDDEINEIKAKSFITRNKRKIAAMQEEKRTSANDNRNEVLRLKQSVKRLFNAYIDSLKSLVLEGLANDRIFSLAGGSSSNENREESINRLYEEFMAYVNLMEKDKEESFASYIEEGVFPPVLRLQAVDPLTYQDYLIKFLSRDLDSKINKCFVESNEIMDRIRILLEQQKMCIGELSNNSGQIVINRSESPTEEESKIFSLVYKEQNN